MTKARDISSGGGLVLINSTTFTSVSTVSINNCFTSAYDNYRVVLKFNVPSSGGSNVSMRLRVSGTDNSSSSYKWAGRRVISWGGASGDLINDGQSTLPVMEMFTGDVNGLTSIDFSNPYNVVTTQVSMLSTMTGGNGNFGTMFYGGTYTSTTQFDGFSILLNSTASGTIKVYGYKN